MAVIIYMGIIIVNAFIIMLLYHLGFDPFDVKGKKDPDEDGLTLAVMFCVFWPLAYTILYFIIIIYYMNVITKKIAKLIRHDGE